MARSDRRPSLSGPRLATAAVAGLVVAIAALPGDARDEESDRAAAAAARSFLDALGPDRRRSAEVPFDDPQRLLWDVQKRRGVRLRDLEPDEDRAAVALLRSGLTDEGYRAVRGCMRVEAAAKRDDRNYWLAVFGPAGLEAPWAWRIEGHHVSITVTRAPGLGTSITPVFLGAEPATVPEGHDDAGYRPLGAFEDAARALLDSLDDAQRGVAVRGATPPKNVRWGSFQLTLPKPAGLGWDAMRPDQRELLLAVVETWIRTFEGETAARARARIREAGHENLAFRWIGETRPGAHHYWQVMGPSFVMELDHFNHDPNHIHMLWRDPEDELGAQLLARHKARHHAREKPPVRPARRGKLY